MAESYFESIRTVGSNLDEGIARLQETWKMPHLLLCKSNHEDQATAKKFVENLRNELKLLKESLDENKATVAHLRETHTQFLEESIKEIANLKGEVDDIRILFAENGYIEEASDNDLDLSILNSQLESLSVGNANSFVKNTDNSNESFTCNNGSLYDSPMRETVDSENSVNMTLSSAQKKSHLNERPMEPMYSPYYYKMMKK